MSNPIPPDLLAELDQAGAAETAKARILGQFYNELRAQGLSERIASQLTRDHLEALDFGGDEDDA